MVSFTMPDLCPALVITDVIMGPIGGGQHRDAPREKLSELQGSHELG